MSEDPKDGLERRDFMIASLATVGASAALVAGATAAAAQGPEPRPAAAGATLTGDVIQGKPVITALDVDSLEPGRHRFYFQGVQSVTGHNWYVSVTVVKGAQPGKRALLTSGVHGDEINSIRTIQKVLDELDPAHMSGTVTAVFDISRPALEGMARRWPNSGRGIDLIDMNRQWPGDSNGFSAPSRHAALLFEGLFRPNADFAIDFHTVASGMDGTAFHIADMSQPEIAEMAMLYPIDQIYDSTGGEGGILMNELTAAGIPSFTPEIGKPRILDLEMIPRFVEGTMNVLRHHGIVAGAIGRTGRDSGVFVANGGFPVVTTHGGIRGAPRRAGRQRGSRAAGRGPVRCLRRRRRGIRERRGRPGDGAPHRRDLRARHEHHARAVQFAGHAGRARISRVTRRAAGDRRAHEPRIGTVQAEKSGHEFG